MTVIGIILGLGETQRVIACHFLLLLIYGHGLVFKVVLLAYCPCVGKTGVGGIIAVYELRYCARAVPGGSAVAVCLSATAHKALVYKVVVAGLGTIQRQYEYGLGRCYLGPAVVLVVWGKGVAALISDYLGVVIRFLVPFVVILGVGLEPLALKVAVVLGVGGHDKGAVLIPAAQPCVMVKEYLGGKHACGILVHAAVLLLGAHVGHSLLNLLDQEIPYMLRGHLQGQITLFCNQFGLKRYIAPQVKQDVVVQYTQCADLGLGLRVVLYGGNLQKLVGLGYSLVAVVPLLPQMGYACIEGVLMQVDVLCTPAAVCAVRCHEQVTGLLVDVKVAFPCPVHETQLYIEVAKYILCLLIRAGQVGW